MERISPPLLSNPDILAAFDIGSNSVRLSVVRLDVAARNWTTLAQYKKTVRLGQDEFESHRLTEAAIDRGVTAMKTFAEIARGYGASEFVAIGTAALREAENRDVFLRRVQAEAGITVQVVPGVEEARLIYLGVASGIELGDQTALFVDIGGGSTELILGTQTEAKMLDSLKLGAIRVANQFLRGQTGPVSPELFLAIQQYIRAVATHATRHIREHGFQMAVASSGTATNLAKIALARAGSDSENVSETTLTTAELSTITRMLSEMTQEERRSVPGLNPERADIIVAGAAVLLTLAEELNVSGYRIAERSLREGLLVDALLRRTGDGTSLGLGVRQRAVERLLRLVEGEKAHARHVAFLTLRLFDQARTLGLHAFDRSERELLEYAALLHDIGVFVARSKHHRHSFYIIRHAEMAGFTDEELQIIANLAYFHRKSPPRKRHEHFQVLSRDNQRLVRQLSVLLRLAEGLDRSHLSLVRDVALTLSENGILLTLISDGVPRLERYYVAEEAAIFEETFGLPLHIAERPVEAHAV